MNTSCIAVCDILYIISSLSPFAKLTRPRYALQCTVPRSTPMFSLKEWNCVLPECRVGEQVFYWRGDSCKIQQGRKAGEWLKVEGIAVKEPMVVINNGTSIFQVNASKLRRPLDTVDLEEPPDSCERTGALVLWLSCEGQEEVWELFSDNSHLSAILDWQGLMVLAPVHQRTRKAEDFSLQALQGFLVKDKKKRTLR